MYADYASSDNSCSLDSEEEIIDPVQIPFFFDMTDVEAFDFTPSWDFYDLMKDPGEKHNAYNDKEYAPIVRNLKK